MNGPQRRLLAIVGAVTAALAMAGCSGIPLTGSVQPGIVLADDDGPDISFLPSAPQTDATPAQIVQGFIDAATSPTGDYAIAREYLTDDFAAEWDPGAEVTVAASRPQILRVEGSDSAFRLRLSTVASVDQLGVYRERDGAQSVLDYRVEQDADGQWRVSAAPDGVVLPQSTFLQVFGAHPVYFFSPGYRMLVPDVRWFAEATAPTSIVSAVLAGPAPWLSGGVVVTAVPEGSGLSLGTVPVVDGVATIDLDAVPSDGTQLRRMAAQLTESLRGVGQIRTVRVTVDQTVVEGAEPLAVVRDPEIDPRPFAITETAGGWLEDGELVTTPLGDAIASLAPSAVAVAGDGSQAAVLAAGLVYRLREGEEPVALDVVDAAAVALDQNGTVWAATPAGIVGSGAATAPVAAAWLGDETVRDLAISRDGTRLAAVVGAGDDWRVVVAGIVRNADGAPVSLSDPLVVGDPSRDVRDVAWYGEATLAVLVRTAGSAQVQVVQVGGQTEGRGAVTAAVALSAADEPDGLRVLADDGTVLAFARSTWQAVASGVRVLATVR